MRTLFSVNHSLPLDAALPNEMKEQGAAALAEIQRLPNAQVIVLHTEGGRYSVLTIRDVFADESEEEKAFWNALEQSNDNVISHLLCSWQNGDLDLPSHRVRTQLCRINEANRKAAILVPTQDGISALRLGVTVK